MLDIDWDRTIGNSQKIITALGIILGTIGAYIKYFRHRTFKPRLEPKIKGKIVCKGDTKYLLVDLQLKNVKALKVDLMREDCTLEVFKSEPCLSGGLADIDSLSAEWYDIGTFPVFEEHESIESGETISEQQAVILSNTDSFALKLALRIVDKKPWFKMLGKTHEWNATRIIQTLN